MRAACLAIVALSLSIVAMLPTASAQPAEKVHHVGALGEREGDQRWVAFRQALRDLGYSEGRNLRITARWSERHRDRLPALAAELVRQKVDVIVTYFDPATHAAKAATTTIPIVFFAGYPVAAGLVPSLGRPGGNLTGFAGAEWGFTEKQMALLKELVPRATRLAGLLEPASLPDHYYLPEARAAADKLGLQLQLLKASTVEQIDRAFEAASHGRADAMHVYAAPLFSRSLARIATLAKSRRLPVMYINPEFVTAGGLISYAPDLRDVGARMAGTVDKILKGARPADLPVEQPTKYRLFINVTTARELGITVPPSLLLQADQLVE
jgi:putative ABC transport system substrate-binding protein